MSQTNRIRGIIETSSLTGVKHAGVGPALDVGWFRVSWMCHSPAAMKIDSQAAHPSHVQKTLRVATAACLLVMCLCVLIEIYTHAAWAAMGASGMLLAFIIVGQGYFGLRERFLLGIAALVTLLALLSRPEAGGVIWSALDRAAFLAAFMILLSLLRDAAATSDAVLAVGSYLTKQPPGRRYAAIHLGGHALGIILNFGALSLLGPLIQRGVKAMASDGDAISAIRERRQISALDRGFSWFIAWSPTAITQAIVPAVIVSAEPGRMAAMGGAVAAVIFVVGWAEDRFRWRHARARLRAQFMLPESREAVFPGGDFLWFLGVCAVLAGLTVAVIFATGVGTIPALMLTAPVITLWWIWIQNRKRGDAIAATLGRYRQVATQSIPEGAPEALTLSAAGYTGLVAGGLVSASRFATTLGLANIPPLLLYALVAAIVPIASNAAMPPILVVTFLGSLLVATPGLTADPTLLGLAFVLGWTLNLTASPFGASSLVLARVTGIPGTTLSWRWNGAFSLAAYGVSVAALTIFASL